MSSSAPPAVVVAPSITLEDAIKKLTKRIKENSLQLGSVENQANIKDKIDELTTAFSGTRVYYAEQILKILQNIKNATGAGETATTFIQPSYKNYFGKGQAFQSAKTSLKDAGVIQAGKYPDFGRELANLKQGNLDKTVIYLYPDKPDAGFWKNWFDRMTENKPIYFSDGEELPLGSDVNFETAITPIVVDYRVLYPTAPAASSGAASDAGGGAASDAGGGGAASDAAGGGAATGLGGGSSSKKTRHRRRRRRRATRRW